MTESRERVISVVLTEQDWRAFVQVHPEPVVWLRQQIQETIDAARRKGAIQESDAIVGV
jgi:hypothetical protein